MGASLTAGLLLAALFVVGTGLMLLKVVKKDRQVGKIQSCQEWWESD